MPEQSDWRSADGPERGRPRRTDDGDGSSAGNGRADAGGSEGVAPEAGSAGSAATEANKVVVQVCLLCGTERIFDTAPPQPGMRCTKCGGKVFRTFYDVPGQDEAHEDFRAVTERDLAPDDAESDVSVDDVIDLNNP